MVFLIIQVLARSSQHTGFLCLQDVYIPGALSSAPCFSEHLQSSPSLPLRQNSFPVLLVCKKMRLELDLPAYWELLHKSPNLSVERKDEVLRASDVMFVVAHVMHEAESQAR